MWITSYLAGNEGNFKLSSVDSDFLFYRHSERERQKGSKFLRLDNDISSLYVCGCCVLSTDLFACSGRSPVSRTNEFL